MPNQAIDDRCINAIRALAMDAVQALVGKSLLEWRFGRELAAARH